MAHIGKDPELRELKLRSINCVLGHQAMTMPSFDKSCVSPNVASFVAETTLAGH